MMDEADQAQDHIEKELAQSIEHARKNAPVFARGVCLNCDEAIPTDRRFCGSECAEDYEHRARQLKRSGVR